MKPDLGKATTKRDIASKTAQIFDPLGLIGPILIVGKMFMQSLWAEQIDWDEQLSSNQLHIWEEYTSSIEQLHNLEITRCVKKGQEFSLVGFCDASERAIGACLYVVSTDNQGKRHAKLLCSKSKVAPLKTISLPRLELEAALLLAQLTQQARNTFKKKVQQMSLWSDNTIVLAWLRLEPHRLKTFVANRVAKIQEMTKNDIWGHVSTAENPADVLSRGSTAADLQHNTLWWKGPAWLTAEESYPVNEESENEEELSDLPEIKSTSVILKTIVSCDLLYRYSSFSRLCRVVAYCSRFIHNAKKPKIKEKGLLQVSEIENAEKIILKRTQHEVFAAEIKCLSNNKDQLPSKNPITRLSPFLDSRGLLCVGGRLQNAQIPEEQKHQILLPPNFHITTILMREEHEKLGHCPPGQLLHSIRQKYWPINGRRDANKVVKKCLKCFRFNPSTPSVFMGDLPEERTRMFTRPFAVTGVDYAGPFHVRESKRRGRVYISKAYVAVFVCFSTKAVHLELVSDLTTKAFLAAMDRFTARRGMCSQVFSDNGTNFVGAANVLKE